MFLTNPPKIFPKKQKNLKNRTKLKIKKNLGKKKILLPSLLLTREKEVEINMKAILAGKIIVDLGKMIEILNRIGMKLGLAIPTTESLIMTTEGKTNNKNNSKIIEKPNSVQAIKM